MHMTMFFNETSIPVKKAKQKGIKPTTLDYKQFPRRATGAELSDEDKENADRPTAIDFPQEWQAQQEKGLNKANITAKDIRKIKRSEMRNIGGSREVNSRSLSSTAEQGSQSGIGIVDAKPRKIKPDFLGPVAVNEKELIERNRLRTVYLALRHAREEKDTDEVEAPTEQLDNVRLNLYNAISPAYDEPDLNDTDLD